MAEACDAVGDPDVAKYHQLFDAIRATFTQKYVQPDGHMTGDTQSGYGMAVHFNLVPENLKPKFAQKYPDQTRGLLAPFQHESWAIGIRQGNTELEAQVNAFLKDFREKKGFDALGDKYLKADKEAFKKMGFPFYF